MKSQVEAGWMWVLSDDDILTAQTNLRKLCTSLIRHLQVQNNLKA